MLGLMAEPKKKESRTHRWNPEILEACEAYIAAQEVAPTEIAVLEAAAREFLAKRGFWPLHKSKGRKSTNGDSE